VLLGDPRAAVAGLKEIRARFRRPVGIQVKRIDALSAILLAILCGYVKDVHENKQDYHRYLSINQAALRREIFVSIKSG
jgi:hypothetical protein